MPTSSVAAFPDSLLRVLCLVIFLAMVIAVVYAGWIAVSNFSRIGV